MPVIKKQVRTKSHPDHDALVHELAKHVRQDASAELASFPKIIEESIRLSNTFRVYVSWNDWASVSDLERSEIILEAYKSARGMSEMLRIASAMGLTPLEAKDLGIDFDSEA